ncbi:hypothetical protein FA09DRAFT_97250 [Tilletiopsis washingtonensis]|uniref:Uncharacterized protein n=1 Tax=Tilletiopsis washingtonensis TaxID=58919 RepID=A0A316Z5D0_9BASI|nr:hypothetical protein FA09DRAFT_97250 [Tilletiopsis washingtonensis]PWN96264.1 hypothetical protein FA09DRAFT_97250 [Tilletiopsis washingtonensis]
MCLRTKPEVALCEESSSCSCTLQQRGAACCGMASSACCGWSQDSARCCRSRARCVSSRRAEAAQAKGREGRLPQRDNRHDEPSQSSCPLRRSRTRSRGRSAGVRQEVMRSAVSFAAAEAASCFSVLRAVVLCSMKWEDALPRCADALRCGARGATSSFPCPSSPPRAGPLARVRIILAALLRRPNCTWPQPQLCAGCHAEKGSAAPEAALLLDELACLPLSTLRQDAAVSSRMRSAAAPAALARQQLLCRPARRRTAARQHAAATTTGLVEWCRRSRMEHEEEFERNASRGAARHPRWPQQVHCLQRRRGIGSGVGGPAQWDASLGDLRRIRRPRVKCRSPAHQPCRRKRCGRVVRGVVPYAAAGCRGLPATLPLLFLVLAVVVTAQRRLCRAERSAAAARCTAPCMLQHKGRADTSMHDLHG